MGRERHGAGPGLPDLRGRGRRCTAERDPARNVAGVHRPDLGWAQRGPLQPAGPPADGPLTRNSLALSRFCDRRPGNPLWTCEPHGRTGMPEPKGHKTEADVEPEGY